MSTQWLPIVRAWADDAPNLTTQLFNPDGSPKEQVEEAKSRTVEIAWEDASDSPGKYAVNLDGTNAAGTQSGSKVRLSYQIPENWQKESIGWWNERLII